jgi:hypothetical protein
VRDPNPCPSPSTVIVLPVPRFLQSGLPLVLKPVLGTGCSSFAHVTRCDKAMHFDTYCINT